MKTLSPKYISISFLFALVIPLQAYGQSAGATTGAIFGTVKDEQGAVITSANIIVRSLQTNAQNTCVSDNQGSYQLLQLRPGNYEITVQANGFLTQTVSTRLLIGVISVNNIVLSIGQNKDSVEVTDSLVNTIKTESSTNITSENIQVLPINRRNFLDFSLTAARVTADRLPPQGVANTSGLSFNGQSARQNIINVDGLDNNDFTSGTVRATFSQEAVQEYQIISDGYSAEFGRALGGVVNIITKGGSNEFHGSNFLFIRNDEISARDAFLTNKPPFEQYQFGTSLSGPIKRDKAFFFTAFERLSVKQNNVVTIPDNTIRSIRNVGFSIRNGAIPLAVASTSVLARVDIATSSTNNLTIRFNSSGRYDGSFESFGGIVAESAGGVQRLTENSIAVTNRYISPNTAFINETRFLYNQRDFNVLPLEDGPQVQIVSLEGLVTFGRSIIVPKRLKGKLFQFSNTTSLVKGSHQLKFGGDLIYISNRSRLNVTASGVSIFAPLDFTGLGASTGGIFSGLEAFDPSLRSSDQRAFLTQLSSILSTAITGFPRLDLANLPVPVFFQQGFPPETLVPTKPKLFAAFLQDDIRINSQLFLKVGIRYDIGRSSFVPTNNGNIAPRLSISYNPNFLPKARLSASYGLFFSVAQPENTEVVVMPNTPRNFFMPFPFSIQAFMQPTRKFASQSAVPANIPLVPQLTVGPEFQPNIRSSYTQQINLGIDYQISNKLKVELDYSFVRGLKLFRSRDINPITRPVAGNPLASFLTGRLDPNMGARVYFESAADSYYHAGSFSIGGELFTNFNLLAHYTLAKAIDNFVDFSPTIPAINPIDPLNPGRERSLSLQDVRSRFVLSGSYQTSGQKNILLKNSTLSTILNLESGRPYNLTVGGDFDMNGDFPPSDRPLGISRNAGITPGFASFDLRLTRSFAFGEKIQVQALVEAFNLFNRTNISQVDSTFPPDPQGKFNLPEKKDGRFISPPERFRNAFAPRQLQVGFRLIF
ncbi:MAG: TonB-dependent receptor [Acidobacteria bacterium]|nr:TonB-dependent receptor [Acidobacteriota bacterium]